MLFFKTLTLMKRLFSLVLLACCVAAVQAQSLLTEKVYLAPMQTACEAGDTVQIVGQVLSSDFADFYAYSSYVNIELLDGKDNVVERQKVRCEADGRFYATMRISGSLSNDVYYLRGYTQFMQNRPLPYYPTSPLFVGTSPGKLKGKNETLARFFPEGGHLTSGSAQRVGVYLYRGLHEPVQAAFTVQSEKGDTVARSQTSPSGLATFNFVPQKSTKYRIALADGAQYDLPAATEDPTFQALIRGGKFLCQVLSAEESGQDPQLYIYHPSFGLKQMTLTGGRAVADVSACSPGVLTVWLTDTAKNVVAQGALWIAPKAENAATVSVSASCAKGATDFISIQDTLPGTKALVRIVPEGGFTGNHAFEALNLEGELSAPIPFPKHYYEATPSEQKKDLDAWLLAAQPSLFTPLQLTGDSLAYPYAIEKSLFLTGNVKQQDDKPLVGASLQIYNTTNGDASLVETDSLGEFSAPLQDFVNGTKVYVQAAESKGKERKYKYEVDEPSVPIVVNPSPYKTANVLRGKAGTLAEAKSFADSTYLLTGVTVRARRKYDAEWMEKQHTPFNFIDGKTMQQRGVVTVEDALRKMQSVDILYGTTRTLRHAEKISSNGLERGREKDFQEIAAANNKGKYVMWKNFMKFMGEASLHGQFLDFIVDGLKIDHDFDVFLSEGVGGIEHIELVGPHDSRSVYNRSPYGFVEIRHRQFMKSEELSSNGICVQPQGLSLPTKPLQVSAPQKSGSYRVLIDLISPDRTVRSFERKLEVKP